MGAFFKQAGMVMLVLLVALIVFLGATREGRAAVKSALFIPQAFDLKIKPLEWFTPRPIVERVAFSIPGGVGQGDLYRPPGKGPYAAALLFLGVAPAGADDPDIINLGKALARSNMVTLFYWSPAMQQKRIEFADVDNLVAAFQYLSSLEYVDPKRVGMGGFCVGASFVLMAAAHESIRNKVAFVNAFGPYFDMRELVGAITSRTKVYDNEKKPWEPDKLTWEVYVLHLTKDLPEVERRALREAFLNGQPLDRDPAQLSRAGQAVHKLLVGVPLEQVSEYYDQIPLETRKGINLISPSAHMEGLKTRVLIMHDRNDDLVPAYESRRLADALRERGDVTHTEYGIFAHVRPNLGSGLDLVAELFRFSRHMHAIMLQAT